MKLQINDAGSWRHVIRFEPPEEPVVRLRSVQMIAVVNERCKLRILDDNNSVRSVAQAPDFAWEDKPH